MELFTPGHLLVLAIVAAVLFFGWKQLPDMARSLGRSLRIFKTEIKGMSADDKSRADAQERSAEPRALPRAETIPTDRPAGAATVTTEPTAAEPPAAAEPAASGEAPAAEAVRARPRPAPRPNGAAVAAKSPEAGTH